MRVLAVAVDLAAVADVAFEAVHGEVHAAEARGFVGLLDGADGEFRRRVLLVFGHEVGGGDEHAARTASGVEDAPEVGLDDFGEEADDAGRGVELAAFVVFGAGDLAEEVFADAAERVVVHGGGHLGQFLQQFLDEGAGEKVVGLGQDAGELRAVLLDVVHGVVDLRADVLGFGAVE